MAWILVFFALLVLGLGVEAARGGLGEMPEPAVRDRAPLPPSPGERSTDQPTPDQHAADPTASGPQGSGAGPQGSGVGPPEDEPRPRRAIQTPHRQQ